MGTLFQAGSTLTAAMLNQYYGFSDTTANPSTGTGFAGVSTQYSIPAGEAVANSAYELACGGFGTWASSGPQSLKFSPLLGTAFGSTPTAAAGVFSTSAAFVWMALLKVTCADGVSGWWGSLSVWAQQTANSVNPGTAADNSLALVASNASVHTASVSSAIAVAVQAAWGSATGSPTITGQWTNFRKTA